MSVARVKAGLLARAGCVALVVLLALALAPTSGARAAGAPVTITNYTDPGQAMGWGYRSHWLQPWRSYLDTVPAETLLNAIGINFNVGSKVAAPTARLLGDSGFRRARIEVGWSSVEYEHPGSLTPLARRELQTTLGALRENGIRPLILLNANDGEPCPVRRDTLQLTRTAHAGATVIHIDPADAAKIVPGRTGISYEGVAAGVLFTAVEPGGKVRLSKPLPMDLGAGPLAVLTLRFEPFRPETLASGAPNPGNEATLRGWLEYVGAVTREAKAILGSEAFDVEVWNELSFGSKFLNINSYYEPDLEWKKNGDYQLILGSTVAYLRNPAHGVPNIGIGNGFASQSPWWNGVNSPPGLTAIDKHPYPPSLSFPEDAQVNGNRPLNGLGEPAGWRDAEGQYHEAFTPSYDAFFPEYALSGIQTETLVRDLSPVTSTIQGAEHGRFTHPPGGSPPAVWITEFNLGPGSGPVPRAQLSGADVRHIMSKDVLRALVAFVNKGVTALDFFAANAGDLSLVEPSFFAAAGARGAAYPGDAAGGETTAAVRRLTEALAGAEPLPATRRLALRELTDFGGNVQFEGNGTAAYPPLYNREVFAFFPFQVTQRRFVIPVYVMTRNVAEDYRPEAPATDPTRFDLPPERYRLAIGGLDGEGATVSASDPLSGQAVPVQVLSRAADQVVVELPVTDSPRLLSIEEAPAEPEPASQPAPSPQPEPQPNPGAEPALGPEPDARLAPVPAASPSQASSPNHGAEEAPSTPLGLSLRGTGGLVSRHRIEAVARCPGQCLVDIHGKLLVGGADYGVLPASGAAPRPEGPSRTAVELIAGPRAVRSARLALRRHAAVTLAITAVVRSGSGTEETLRRRVALR
jgi:hypothetical protein